jgi:hypothetical protein
MLPETISVHHMEDAEAQVVKLAFQPGGTGHLRPSAAVSAATA